MVKMRMLKTVKHYTHPGGEYKPLKKGDIVEFDEDVAEEVERAKFAKPIEQ